MLKLLVCTAVQALPAAFLLLLNKPKCSHPFHSNGKQVILLLFMQHG